VPAILFKLDIAKAFDPVSWDIAKAFDSVS
jgi:hypothetical protein